MGPAHYQSCTCQSHRLYLMFKCSPEHPAKVASRLSTFVFGFDSSQLLRFSHDGPGIRPSFVNGNNVKTSSSDLKNDENKVKQEVYLCDVLSRDIFARNVYNQRGLCSKRCTYQLFVLVLLLWFFCKVWRSHFRLSMQVISYTARTTLPWNTQNSGCVVIYLATAW